MASVKMNPFHHSGPVTGDQFCDRKEELEQLVRWLSTSPPTSIAVYGPERIGKTSLLRQLNVVGVPNRRLFYLDMQGILSPEEFWDSLRKFLKAGADESVRDALDRTQDVVVLCLDEFGKVLSRPEFTADFYDLLRSLTQSGKLALVISVLRSLRELSVPSGADVSRFFNILRPLPLVPFPEEDARALLTSKGLSEGEARWILEHVREKYHPYHLQLLGAYLWEAKEAGREREEALKRYHRALEGLEGPPPGAPPPSALDTAAMVLMALAMLSLLMTVILYHPLLLGLAAVCFIASIVLMLIDRLRRR